MNCSHAASNSAKSSILVAQVVIGRHQIGLRDLHRRLRATLRLGIRGLAGRDRQPVMTGNVDDRRVADRDPAHVIDRHRLLVIGQRVGRHTVEPPQRPVQPDHHRRQRLLAQRHHHPIARPRQPRAEQHRPRAARRPARRRNPTAATTPAPESTAACAGRASAATGAWPPRPPAASCAPNPDTPSRPASNAPDRHRSAHADRSTNSSIFTANGSTSGRRRSRSGSPPPAASRAATSRATVL